MTQAIPAKRSLPYWLAGLFLIVAAGLLATTQARLVSEPYYGDLFTTAAAGLTAIMVVLWFVFSIAAPRWARWIGSAIGIAILVGITSAMGIHGDYGDMSTPRPHSHGRLAMMNFSTLDDYRAPAKDLTLPALDTTIDESSTVDLKNVSSEDYLKFLGSSGHGVIQSPPLAEDWTADPPRKIWRMPIGSGLSESCVVGDYFVTQEQRSESELVTCYQLSTGKLKWAHADKTRFSEGTAGDGPRATVTIFDGKVYSMGGTGMLNCLDGRTGKVIWSHNCLVEHKQAPLNYGQSESPLVFDNMVVVCLGGSASPSLAAFDNRTGAPLWVGGSDVPGYSSPVVATLAGQKQIITVNNNSVSACDPADGRQLWSWSWPGGAKCSQPVPFPPDRVYVSCSYGLGAAMLQIKNPSPGKFTVVSIWKKPYIKTQFNNVVIRGGFAFGLDDGIIACQDLATGALKWKNGRYGSGQVLLVNDDLLITTDGGDIALMPATPEKPHELTHFTILQGRMWTCPTLSRGYLIVRVDGEIACYKLPFKNTAAPAATSPSAEKTDDHPPASNPG